MIAKRNRYSVKEFKLMFICSHMPRCNMGSQVRQCTNWPSSGHGGKDGSIYEAYYLHSSPDILVASTLAILHSNTSSTWSTNLHWNMRLFM